MTKKFKQVITEASDSRKNGRASNLFYMKSFITKVMNNTNIEGPGNIEKLVSMMMPKKNDGMYLVAVNGLQDSLISKLKKALEKGDEHAKFKCEVRESRAGKFIACSPLM